MKNDTTDVYAIMLKEFPETSNYFRIPGNKEIESFVHYNAHNEQFDYAENAYGYFLYFKNLDTGRFSRLFTEGPIYFFPRMSEDIIEPENKATAFTIRGDSTRTIRVNDNGLYVEDYNLKDRNITVRFYDMAALKMIAEKKHCFASIDVIENYLDNECRPDKTINAEKIGDIVYFYVVENGEKVFEEEIPFGKDRTFYSVYFEKMKSMGLYLDAQKVDAGTSR